MCNFNGALAHRINVWRLANNGYAEVINVDRWAETGVCRHRQGVNLGLCSGTYGGFVYKAKRVELGKSIVKHSAEG